MMLAKDRDVAALEPVLVDSARRVARWQGVMVGSVLTLSGGTGGVSAQAASIGPGSILRLGDGRQVVEVAARLGPDEVRVCHVRAADEEDEIPLPDAVYDYIDCMTFRPELYHASVRLLAMVGLGLADIPRILNRDALVRLTVELVAEQYTYGALGIHLVEHRQRIRERARTVRARLIVVLDNDGDGVAHVTRRGGVTAFVREGEPH
jgi:hypothetical protein